MNRKRRFANSIICGMLLGLVLHTQTGRTAEDSNGAWESQLVKRVLNVQDASENLLDSDGWRFWGEGFTRQGEIFVCDNGDDAQAQRGISQTVVLDQRRPEPIVAAAWSKAENVGGGRNSDYSLYLDLTYQDGTPLWGQVDTFGAGSHDWAKAEVMIFPEKPVKTASFHMLFRRHAGKALFRDPELRVLRPPAGACLFDGVAISPEAPVLEGFQVRDVAAGTDFFAIEHSALDVRLECDATTREGVTFFDVVLSDISGADRAITLIYAIPVSAVQCRWHGDPRHTTPVERGREYLNASRFRVGSNGQLSRYPFAAVSNSDQATALGIDMARPAFFRAGYNAATGETDRSLAVLQIRLRSGVGIPRRPGGLLRSLSSTFRSPRQRTGTVDAVCQDQRGEGLARLWLRVQGGNKRDGVGR